MKRKIIKIDENKCNGCGLCIPNCPEGALKIINGKARLVSELTCDGLGACLGHCPQGAITVEEREAKPYDEKKVMVTIAAQGRDAIESHLKHLQDHNQDEYLLEALEYLKEHQIEIGSPKGEPLKEPCGCPGSRVIDRRMEKQMIETPPATDFPSELRQWPIQLHLLNPHAPYFHNADLVIAADCVPFTYAGFHRRFLKNKILIIFCPKLDQGLEQYVEKLSELFKDNAIKSITIVRMEVPCCGGVTGIVAEALSRSEKRIIVKEYTISLQGEII